MILVGVSKGKEKSKECSRADESKIQNDESETPNDESARFRFLGVDSDFWASKHDFRPFDFEIWPFDFEIWPFEFDFFSQKTASIYDFYDSKNGAIKNRWHYFATSFTVKKRGYFLLP